MVVGNLFAGDVAGQRKSYSANPMMPNLQYQQRANLTGVLPHTPALPRRHHPGAHRQAGRPADRQCACREKTQKSKHHAFLTHAFPPPACPSPSLDTGSVSIPRETVAELVAKGDLHLVLRSNTTGGTMGGDTPYSGGSNADMSLKLSPISLTYVPCSCARACARVL